jgi:ribokinase
MFDVISVGSATIDVFAKTESELIEIKTLKGQEELIAYPSGTKILITDLEFLSGGGGTNTAVSFAKLGFKTAYLGKIGNDDNGKKVLQLLAKEKVKFVGAIGKEITGYSIILDSIEEERTILAYKGANNNLKFSEIKPSNLKTKWFYFSSMIGESYKTLEKIATYAQKNNIKIVFNPSSYLAEKGVSFLKNVLAKTEVLILNKEEAELLVGKDTIESVLKNLQRLGPKIVIITEGKHGVHAADSKHVYFLAPHKKIKVAETTGAGDSFASGFLAGFMKKKNIEFGLRLGLANAESVVCCYGAKNGLLNWKNALTAIKAKPAKIKKKLI